MSGPTQALTTVVEVRSYSLIRGSTSGERLTEQEGLTYDGAEAPSYPFHGS